MTENTVTTSVDLHSNFVALCELHQTTPQHVIEQFVRDLLGVSPSSGSDERRMAWEYYERCGYPLRIRPEVVA